MSNNVAASRVALVGLLALVLATPATAQSALPAASRVSLEKHCADIRDVFKLARFTGEFKRRADAFVAGGCRGAVPIPDKGDAHNIQRWNTSADILSTDGIQLN